MHEHDKVSDESTPEQQSAPRFFAFDAGFDDAEDAGDVDTVLAPPDDEPTPPAPAAALVVRAPRGVLAPRSGFHLYAVREERDRETGEVETVDAVVLRTDVPRWREAFAAAQAFAADPPAIPGYEVVGPTKVVINDGNGLTHWWFPLPRAARAA